MPEERPGKIEQMQNVPEKRLAKLSRCMAAAAELAPKVRAREVGMSALVNTTALRLMFSS